MAQFELTARHTMNNHGLYIDRGTKLNINIPLIGITQGNFFGNPRCANTILQQLAAQGIIVPSNSPILNRGHWDIKVK